MLTVKVIDTDGHEMLKADVKSVMYNPKKSDQEASVFIWYKEEIPETILRGRVYVMNEYGKTVADYEMLPPRQSPDSFTTEERKVSPI